MAQLIMLCNKYFDFDNQCYYVGGIETYLRALCHVARDLYMDPVVVFPWKSSCREVLPDGEVAIGVTCRPGPTYELIDSAKRMGDVRADILVFGTSTLASKHPFAKSVAIQHGVYWDLDKIHGRRLKSREMATALRMVQAWTQLRKHDYVDAMICVDCNYINWMRAITTERLPYVYIPNFAPMDADKHITKYYSEGVSLIFARRFERIRGCELIIQTLPQLMGARNDIHLTIAGSGSMAGALHDAFDRFENVTFTTYDVTESLAIHAVHDIALVPSIGSEGTSLSLLEAMSAGCAVVSTEVGGMSNIVLDGFNGLLIRPNQRDLFDALIELIDNPGLRDELGRHARETVQASFSYDRWKSRWSSVLSSLSGGA